jgi:hypothetical protein
MKLLNVVWRKADNASVLAADIVNAGQAQNDGLTDRQYRASEIASHHDVLPRCVRTNGH